MCGSPFGFLVESFEVVSSGFFAVCRGKSFACSFLPQNNKNNSTIELTYRQNNTTENTLQKCRAGERFNWNNTPVTFIELSNPIHVFSKVETEMQSSNFNITQYFLSTLEVSA